MNHALKPRKGDKNQKEMRNKDLDKDNFRKEDKRKRKIDLTLEKRESG